VTVFGRTLGVEEISTLVFLSMSLVLWLSVLRGEQNWKRWFRGWEADRKARRDAELAAERGGERDPGAPRGPWG